ncbi:MAG TPA: phosphoribosylamine--glycine ligase [candidate division WOR-3 bacterium]|uniref:Phosphoribosylamine--glycine ligase n=1 Tax=candidate division WOR-3 bacterium TaxID=2052148 RepID=A0A7V5HNF9_UNCW3|nr:phosphoribosylamine--glycine ligase [candidate division WOR-3 bacterium]
MKVMVLGKGGRENAIVWKLSISSYVDELYAVPGNPGTKKYARNIHLNLEDFETLAEFVKENKIEIVIPGPEGPIANGIKDYIEEKTDAYVFSPSSKSSFLEASKIKAKQFMKRNNVPTADFKIIESYEEGVNYLNSIEKYPVVIKADGLAQGKGVSIAQSHIEAVSILEEYIKGRKFGEASSKVVIEEFLTGHEYSVFIITDGRDYIWIGDACDYKRAFDGDRGPNTGGMGSISPAPFLDSEKRKITEDEIIKPTLDGLIKESIPYEGFLYFGLIWTENGPKVLEYNIRLGDPEAQVILPRLKNDLMDLIIAVKEHRIKQVTAEISKEVCMCLVVASGGYPVEYEKGKEIKGLEKLSHQIILFHAGTEERENKIYTAGGRVLNLVAIGKDFEDVRRRIYREVEKIHFENIFYRRDIGLMERWR